MTQEPLLPARTPRWRRTLGAAAGLVAALVVGGMSACERVELQSRQTAAPSPVVQAKTLRSRITTDGLGSLYRTAHAGALPLAAGTVEATVDGSPISIGPLDDEIPAESWKVSVDGDVLDITLSADDGSVTLPVRVPEAIGTRICRFRVRTGHWSVDARAVNRAADGWDLEAVAPPNFEPESRRVDVIGGCPALVDDRGQLRGALEEVLTDFIGHAVDDGVRQILETSPFDTMGLLRDDLTLRRISSFSNRHGRLRLLGQFPESDAIGLAPAGLRADLNVGISAERADCAPPENLDLPDKRQADPVEDSALSEADLGIAIAAPLLRRLARASTLGGFLCRGLENDAPPFGSASITPEAARLSAIGLQGVGGSGELDLSVSPGGLPELRLRPDSGGLALTFQHLNLELYGQVRGVRSRLVDLTTNATFILHPNTDAAGQLDMTINAVEIDDVSAQSAWTDPTGADVELTQWTTRILLLVFEDAFSFPLPITPDAPLALQSAQVRSHDVLLLMDVHSP